MNKPDWLTLIEQWVPSGMGSEGVTLPYLVGALAHSAGKSNAGKKDIREVLDSMSSKPVEGFVTEVMWCGNIKAPVFKVVPIDSARRIKSPYKIPHPSGNGESIVFSENLKVYFKEKDPDALLRSLIDDTCQPVLEGRFSRQRSPGKFMEYEYNAFTERDLAYIEKTIGEIAKS